MIDSVSMSHHPFRNMTPQRTCTKKRTDYHAYKAFLAEDFNHRCGYTDCSDHWFGGKRNFQIDHLKPKSIYPELVVYFVICEGSQTQKLPSGFSEGSF